MGTKEERIFWQQLKICPACHKNHLYDGAKECFECRAYFANYANRYYATHKDAIKARLIEGRKNLYKRRKEQGLCPRCGSKFIKPGKVSCYRCLAKAAESSRLRYQDKIKEV